VLDQKCNTKGLKNPTLIHTFRPMVWVNEKFSYLIPMLSKQAPVQVSSLVSVLKNCVVLNNLFWFVIFAKH
jgi:hypothetical protein